MLEIRSIQFEDLPDLSALYEELVPTKTNFNKLAEAFRSIENNNNYNLLGAFDEGRLAGSLMGIICQDLVGDCKPFMVIENVIVSGRARRKGIGKRLMTDIERIARERGCYYIILVSGGHRKEAHLLYESLGYKEEKVEGYRKHLNMTI